MNSSLLTGSTNREVPECISPVLYPAISTLRARGSPVDHLQVIKAVGFGSVLISAYDVARATDQERLEIHRLVERIQQDGQTVMLDSGGYEAFWKGDEDWTQSQYKEAAGDFEDTINLGFDYRQPTGLEDADTLIDHAIRGAEQAQLDRTRHVIPIVHARSDLMSVARDVFNNTGSPGVAIPEKGLGDGILDRSSRLEALRVELGQGACIHVLGAGSPIDIGVYAAAGANSFDGLEWARCYIDQAQLRCHNAAYWQILDPTEWARADELGWFFALAVNNLIALKAWMESIAAAEHRHEIADLVSNYFPETRFGS